MVSGLLGPNNMIEADKSGSERKVSTTWATLGVAALGITQEFRLQKAK